MGVRHYVSDILPPDTTEDSGKDFWRTAIDDDLIDNPGTGVSSASEIPPSPDGKGEPAFTWAVVVCSGDDFTVIDADPRNFRIFPEDDGQATPQAALTRLSSRRRQDLPSRSRNAINAKLDDLGIPVADLTGATSLRAILQKFGRHLNPKFDETRLFAG